MSVTVAGFSVFGFVFSFASGPSLSGFIPAFWSAIPAVFSFVVLSCGLGSSAFFKCLLHEIIKGGIAGDWLCMVCEKLGFSCGTFGADMCPSKSA
jgi:hypothetical protein